MAKQAKGSFDQYLLFNPESPWVKPESLPDLSQEQEVAIDTETRDPMLAHDLGPGFFAHERWDPNTGYICGISVAWRDQKIYIPTQHRDFDNFDHELVQRWLKSLAKQSLTRFVFHNFQYDWGWLEAQYGVPPPNLVDDTGAMAAMINENLPSFTLDDLCAWQGLPGKDERLLEEVASLRKIPVKDIKKNLWQFEAKHVGPYAEQDAASTLALAGKLRPLLSAENLDYAYEIERELMPVTLKMKQRGIRIDAEKAERLASNIIRQRDEQLINISSRLGEKVDVKCLRSNRWLRDKFDTLGLKYPKTLPSENFADGQASFEKSFMANHPHWFPQLAFKIKHQTDFAEKFLKTFILKHAYRGRVYPTVNQFRNEEGGTRSHRFSYSDPPLQQMPSRDDELAPLIRSCFIPEDGEVWCSIDWRQQEYRLIVFIAELVRARGAQEAANMYRSDPETDFHDYVAEITRLKRKRAKDVNFATSYGAGVKKFSIMTGMDEEEAKKVMDQYHERLPFVHIASDRYNRFAAQNGYIKMIDGARGHFNLWEPIYRDFAREIEFKKRNPEISTLPCFAEEFARRKEDSKHPWYGERCKRAYTHKSFNRMIQGSAARQMKKAMVDIVKAKYFPVLQLHDELCFSFADPSHAKICARIMEEAVPLITIPMLTDVRVGASWGDLKK